MPLNVQHQRVTSELAIDNTGGPSVKELELLDRPWAVQPEENEACVAFKVSWCSMVVATAWLQSVNY